MKIKYTSEPRNSLTEAGNLSKPCKKGTEFPALSKPLNLMSVLSLFLSLKTKLNKKEKTNLHTMSRRHVK